MISKDITDELHQNFIDSSYEVNANRAFPDVRDGLKPGQRACLWAMWKHGFHSNKPHVKSAKVDGTVAASLWPHGTSAIYETFARMSQPFTNNVPEVDFHGANGNVILGGDAIAADRYTEVRLSPVVEDGMLAGVDKNAVDMQLNFSEDEEWPTVLPSIFPRLLVNGAQGIGVGLANNWTLHNFQETADAILEYMKTGECLTGYYPDFPTGATIVNQDELDAINETGRGRIVMESKWSIDGKDINFTEFPYQVYVEPLIEEIKAAVEKEQVHGVKEVFNKSDKNRVLLTVTCASKSCVKQTLAELMAYTSLSTQLNVNQVALVGKTPMLVRTPQVMRAYVKHGVQCIRREHAYDLDKTRDRLEILEGLKRALDGIDAVIALMRQSASPQDAKDYMVSHLDLTERQADAILAMRLSRLAKLEVESIEKELAEKRELAEKLEAIISSEARQKTILRKRLTELAKKYGTPRRTTVQQGSSVPNLEDVAPQETGEPLVICMSKDDLYVKAVKKAKYRSTDDTVLMCADCLSTDTLRVWCDDGRVYKLKASVIPICLASDKGTVLDNLIARDGNRVLHVDTWGLDTDLLAITTDGRVKRFNGKEGDGESRNQVLKGMSYIKLNEGCRVVALGERLPYVRIDSTLGRAVAFETTDLNIQRKSGSGQIGIRLDEGDTVLSVECGVDSYEGLGRIGSKGMKIPRIEG